MINNRQFYSILILFAIMFIWLSFLTGSIWRESRQIKIPVIVPPTKSDHIELKGSEIKTISVTVTAYSPEEAQTDSTPFITAFNTPVQKCGIAISRDLEKEGLIHGSWLVIPELREYCSGIVFVNDRMHKRKKRQIDLFFFKTERAIAFGIKRNVRLILI